MERRLTEVEDVLREALDADIRVERARLEPVESENGETVFTFVRDDLGIGNQTSGGLNG